MSGLTRFLGHATRGEDWVLPRRFRAVAMMGGIDLDLTRARIGPGDFDIDLVAFLGVIVVTIPSDVHVEPLGDAIVVVDQRKPGVDGAAKPEATIRIRGRAMMGRIEVKLVDGVGRGRLTSSSAERR